MAALKIRKGKLTPADLARFGILPQLPKVPKVPKVPKPKTLERAPGGSKPDLVF
jgi:hypothetical protein